MSARFEDVVLDRGLAWLVSQAVALHVCSSEPSDYATAISASLGHATPLLALSPAPGGNGRCAASGVVYGSITSNGTANWWALVGTSSLLARGATIAPIDVVAGELGCFGDFYIAIPSR